MESKLRLPSYFLLIRLMLQRNRVIVLRIVRFKENSLIVSCYAQEHGRITLLVNNAFPKGKKVGLNVYFQPLSILDVVYYYRPNAEIFRVKEVTPSYAFASLHLNPVKLTITIFLSELIYRTVREQETNQHLFAFIESSVQMLDNLNSGIANFHLIFMVQLTRYLGFYPLNRWSPAEPYFDIKNGIFCGVEPSHGFVLEKQTSKLLNCLIDTPMLNPEQLSLNHNQRQILIEAIVSFYRFHLGSGVRLRTLPILIQLFE